MPTLAAVVADDRWPIDIPARPIMALAFRNYGALARCLYGARFETALIARFAPPAVSPP